MASPTALRPGLVLLHGNRLELLQETVFSWLASQPLGPLEEEVLLVQSNGIAEWLKMSLARRTGVCAATRVELPARFLWRAYRHQLGREAAPARSPLDKEPLAWRLMRLLPLLARQPGFEPLAQFLAGPPADHAAAGDAARRLQLARRLADLYDQYQIYRADWLQAWAVGRDEMDASTPLPPDQRWQAQLWRALLLDLNGDENDAAGPTSRADVHTRFVAALQAGEAPRRPLPRRVVLVGHSHLPLQTLEALAALSLHSQVLLAVPNPCQYHWADMIDGRELLQAARRYQPARPGADLAALPLADAHAQAHPLLAAWGRQGRDFLRALDHFDEMQTAAGQPEALRVPLFDESDGDTLLTQIQARIRDAVPLAEHAALQGEPLDSSDRSVVFHLCHSALREVEVLHDQLLGHLAAGDLAPRDIVVMVPEIDAYAPLIRAVFGQHGPADARRIPYDITDLRARGRQPMLVALEWLLRITEQRCTASELRDLLDVPALAHRFGLGDDDLALAARWLAGAGVRWGLDEAQRASLGLAACGDANTWLFGLRRMLLGYACGDLRRDVDAADAAAVTPWHDIAPYDEVGGLDAAVAGALALLVDALQSWWQLASTPARPAQWQQRGHALLARFFKPVDEDERLLQASLQEALDRWADACAGAALDEALPLAVLREAWLDAVDEPGLGNRFMSGGVVFCTLMPMRAIPFQIVALLGMNDGDYPRRAPRSDFDLLALPGQRRPGDRARRDDDRMLMLEALLSARRTLHISWAARSVRDNTEQPPSLLVAQLRDYIAAAWGAPLLQALTFEHPLQPFSRRYFEVSSDEPSGEARAELRTYAREWRSAHDAPPSGAAMALPPPDLSQLMPLQLGRLQSFLRRPVAEHLRQRLDVVLREPDATASDEEPLSLDALEETLLLRGVLRSLPPPLPGEADSQDLGRWLHDATTSLQRQGQLPLAGPGQRWRAGFARASLPMLAQWQQQRRALPELVRPLAIDFKTPSPDGLQTLHLQDWIDGLCIGPEMNEPVWLQATATRLCSPAKKKDAKPGPADLRPDKLLDAWLVMLTASACGHALQGLLIGRDVMLRLTPPAPDTACQVLSDLLQAWHHGLGQILPVALRSALAGLREADEPDAWSTDALDAAQKTYDGQEGGYGGWPERDEPALARLYPDWAAISAEPDAFATWAEALYRPLLDWTQRHIRVEPLPQAVPFDPNDPDEADDADAP